MYKLENNVAWTNDLKQAFKKNITRAIIRKDDLLLTESNVQLLTQDDKELGTTITINENSFLKSIKITENRYVPDVGFIGQAVAKMATINLTNNADSLFNLENQEIEIKIGADYNNQTYYINYGTFIINQAPQNDKTNGTVRITAYDSMIKFNKPYDDIITYPCTLKELLINICSQAGVELGSEHFANENFIVENNQFENKTLREVLQNIAKCAFSWARIKQDNKLYLDFEVKNTVDEVITIQDYKKDNYKIANELYGSVNKVTYGDSDIKGQEISIANQSDIIVNGENEILINDNYFAYTQAKRNSLIQEGTRLFGLKYMPIQELKMIGLIYLESNDIIEVEDLEENTIKSIVFSHTIEYNGVTSDEISAESFSDNEKEYKNNNTIAAKQSQTEIIVDKANKKIQSIASEIGDRSERTSTITQEIDRINSVVEDIEDLTNTIKGLTEITLENCVAGQLLELHIYGNNTVFDYLYPQDDLYPSDTLFPYGDSRIVVTDSQGNEEIIELGVMEVLRQNGEIKDEFILENSKAKIIRRILPNGQPRLQELIEELPDVTINLKDGNNIISIKNYEAYLQAKFAIQNDYTDIFATKALMSSSITQTAEEINLEVRKKVDENEVISKINQSAEEIAIEANKISLSGKTLNLGDNMAIVSNNFNVDSNGNMTCSNANITNGNITMRGENNKIRAVASNNSKTYAEIYSDERNSHVTVQDSSGFSASIEAGKYRDGTPFSSIEAVAGDGDINNATISCAGSMKATSFIPWSTLERKKDIELFKSGLEILNNVEIYMFRYKGQEKNSKKHIGFIINNDYKYSKQLTNDQNDGVDLYSFISVCCKAIQEQQEEIEELQNKIKEMEEKNG